MKIVELSNCISTCEASKRLGIHEESLRRIVRIGTLQAEKIGNQWFIDKDTLEMFAATYDPKTGRRK